VKIDVNGYFFIYVTWASGFKHIVPCRGYSLRSNIEAVKKLDMVKEYHYKEVKKKDFDKRGIILYSNP